MNVLFVCSGNYSYISPYILEQANSLKRLGINVDFFLIKGKGFLGYLFNYPKLKRIIKHNHPALIHAHFGLSGMLAILQRTVPVIITFHGSDINNGGFSKLISNIAFKFSKWSIYVTKHLAKEADVKGRFSIIPCGVDLSKSFKLDKIECRNRLGFNLSGKYILFSSAFDNPVKNYALARRAVDFLGDAILLELKGYKKDEVNLLMNASDCVLLTSYSEGSPQVIKEAMACNCPIVATDVGDIRLIIGDTAGCFLTSFDAKEVAEDLNKAIQFSRTIGNTTGRLRIIKLGYDSETIARKIIEIYKTVLKE
jgi:teichuronic acid biosynthesis glycosyltransferase TuaC